MTYYDDEEENEGARPAQPGRPAGRGEFRADPSFSPRAGYPQPQQPPYAAAPSYPDADPHGGEPGPDDYVQPQHHQPQYHHADGGLHADPAAAGYRSPAPDPQADAYQQQAGYQGQAAYQAQEAYYQQYDQQYGYQQPEPRSRRNLVNIGVFAVAILVFGSIIFYAYNQGMRAGTESVAPILRADTSPTKIRPEQPGGMEVPHQDKLVYDRLNPASNDGDGEVERLLPPPEAPMERPRASAEPAGEEDMMPMAEEGEGQISNMPAEQDPVPAQPSTGPAYTPAYTPNIPQTQTPVQQPARPAPAPVQPQVQQQTQQQAALPPAPAPKPVAPAPTATTAPKVLTPPAATTTPAPKPATTAAPVATGGASVRIQVAAVDSEGKASTEWQRLQKKFAGELGSLSMRTVRVDLPKGTFYRIQAGPVDEARAKQICATMAAQGAGCSIVR